MRFVVLSDLVLEDLKRFVVVLWDTSKLKSGDDNNKGAAVMKQCRE